MLIYHYTGMNLQYAGHAQSVAFTSWYAFAYPAAQILKQESLM